MLLLISCTEDEARPVAYAEGDADADADCDDTGVSVEYWYAALRADGAEFASAEMGTELYGLLEDAVVCSRAGELAYDGPGAEGCPDCTWAWSLSFTGTTTVEGTECPEGWTSSTGEPSDTYDWGFAQVYAYDYAGTPIYFEDALLLYGSYGWFLFAFNASDYGIYGVQDVYGDGSYVRMADAATGSDGAYYYTYYDRCD
ncbi:MAG: hypothetical protein ACOZNI_17345 [Myxococcota bacterium]